MIILSFLRSMDEHRWPSPKFGLIIINDHIQSLSADY